MKITVEYEEDDGSFLNFDFNPFHMSNPRFIHRRIKSFGFAIQGVVTFCKTQPNGWIHLLGALFAIALGLVYKINPMEWCMIVFAIAFVIATEMLNTGLEFLTDLASPSIHPLAKKAKDVAAGAVLVAAIASVVIAAIIFLPKIACNWAI